MSDIRFLLKFGQKEHMENLVAGNLYCSNAQINGARPREQRINKF